MESWSIKYEAIRRGDWNGDTSVLSDAAMNERDFKGIASMHDLDRIIFVKPWKDVFVGATGTIVDVNGDGTVIEIDICTGVCPLACSPMTMMATDYHCIDILKGNSGSDERL